MIEPKRGCGYRKLNALYIEGRGLTATCDRLPFNLLQCPTCGHGIKFTRGITFINWSKYAGQHKNCKESHPCPICKPKPDSYALMFVGKSFYTPDSFIQEAIKHGVSKRIGNIPHSINLCDTWVLLAHTEAGTEHTSTDLNSYKDTDKPAIFYAFKPKRIVKMITPKQSQDTKLLNKLSKRGITPLVSLADKNNNIRQSFTLEQWKTQKTKIEDFIA